MKYRENALLFLAGAIWVLFALGHLSDVPDQSVDSDWSVAQSEKKPSHPSLHRVAVVQP